MVRALRGRKVAKKDDLTTEIGGFPRPGGPRVPRGAPPANRDLGFCPPAGQARWERRRQVVFFGQFAREGCTSALGACPISPNARLVVSRDGLRVRRSGPAAPFDGPRPRLRQRITLRVPLVQDGRGGPRLPLPYDVRGKRHPVEGTSRCLL